MITILACIAGYFAITLITYILSPVIFKYANWDINSSHSPPPECIAFFWPFVIIFSFFWLILRIVIILPFELCSGLQIKVANYISNEAIAARKEKRLKKKEMKIRLSDESDKFIKEFHETTLAYRESHCGGCGQNIKVGK